MAKVAAAAGAAPKKVVKKGKFFSFSILFHGLKLGQSVHLIDDNIFDAYALAKVIYFFFNLPKNKTSFFYDFFELLINQFFFSRS
jgi:hypothetical protein